jgi:K+-transporting ATPase ATPase C chain
MIRNLVRATIATLVLAVITGLIYPLVMTGFAQVAFHAKANGSVVTVNGRPVGSALVGQQWAGPQWFYGRPSVIDYHAWTSQGSNLGPLSQALATDIDQRAKAIKAIEGPYHPGLTTAQIPVDLLTASASGLDPQISPAAADFQAPRIAAVRHMGLSAVMALIRQNTSNRTFGFLGEPRVNVLALNLALARAAGPT